ncbi:MAG: alpha/beta fold hydrolase [Armatimonadetes bacterium]|nr:alpha/beta fold hydrolase [Armatimonadota bacterium]
MRSTRQKKRFRRAIYFLAGLFLAYIVLCFWIADKVVSPRRVVPSLPKDFVVWEPVKGVPAWASPTLGEGKAKNLFIFAHGIKASRAFFEDTARELQHRGYDVVILPMPGHDASPEPTVGFGTTESKLIRETIDAAHAQHTVLVGASMGGASCWMASDDPHVDGIVTECAFGRLEPVTHRWFNSMLPYGDILFKPVIWIASARLHINPNDINPVETAQKWDHTKPALVIEASDDRLIPEAQSKELASVSGADFWRVPFATHANCQSVGKEYIDRVEGVMKKVLRH